MELSAPPPERGFGIDARSLHRERRRAQDSLRLVAEQTGGEAILDTNDLSTAYGRIVRASSHYYRIGYQPSDFRPDGAFRRIEVRVARPGVSVIARKGYARPRTGEDGRRAERAAPTGTSSELRELLHRPWPQGGLPLGVSAAVFKVTAASATVAVTVQVPGRALASGNGAAGEVELALIAVDEGGRVQAGDRVLVPPGWDGEAREVVQRQGLRFVRRIELPAGRHQLRVAVREGAGGRRGSVFYDLQVPRYAETKLAMSGVLLTSRAAAETPTLAFDDVVKSLLDAPPTVARTFTPDDVLTVYAEVYDALEGDHDLSVTTRVTGADGGEVLRADDQRASAALQTGGGGVRHRIEIPLARFAPGTYVLRTEATPTVGGSRAAREVSFEVRPGLAARASADIGSPPAASSARWTGPRPASRMDRLAAWLAAVEAHQPGEPDGPAVMVRTWPAADLAELATDATTLARLMRDPGYPVTWLVDPARPGRPERAPYTLADEQRLRAAAREAAARCGARIPPAPADGACASNPLLKRGAMLHTDAAVLFAEGEEPGPSAGRDLRPDRWRVRYADGQQQHTEGASGHWDLAKVLLDGVAPHPAQDETVRLWYVAVGAYGQYYERHTRLEDRAAELFPDDPDVLFLAGTLHEAFASPRIQRLVRTMRLPAGTTHGIGSERSELRKAEGFLRRAVERKPGLVEARIRWGRVLHGLGRHEPAVRELQKAVGDLASGASRAGDEGGLLAYYAEMFLGAAAESRGRRELARASYGRAVELRSSAPSPRLALSRLALADNDRAAALDAVREAVRPDNDEDRDDPWWRYHVVQGRRVDTWFEALRRSLAAQP
jgi:tetratricopeptide (TPR) repeat protein